jgi:uncharacterized protein YecE (DUF72 family)
MPIGIPDSMREEHEELHDELRKAARMAGTVGKAAKRVAKVLHPYFERENDLASPVIGIARELAEGKISPDFRKALELSEKFKVEYERMLQEHVEIVKALSELEKAAKKAKKASVADFARKLRMHAKTEEGLTYPTVLMIGKTLKQTT